MKSFIIHLPDIKNSKQHAEQTYDQLTSMGMTDVNFFVGCYPNEAEELFKKERIKIQPTTYLGTPLRESRINRPGVKGCFRSHYLLWKYCHEHNEPILIFEDDIKFKRPFVHPKNWNDEILIVVLSHYYNEKHPNYSKYLTSPSGIPIAQKYDRECMPGTGGYAITPTSAKKLLDFYSSSYTAADHAINTRIVDIKIHTFIMGITKSVEDGKMSIVGN